MNKQDFINEVIKKEDHTVQKKIVLIPHVVMSKEPDLSMWTKN